MTGALGFRPIGAGDAQTLLVNIRPMDLRELTALGDPLDVLSKGVATSTLSAAATWDGELQCLFGVVPDVSEKLAGIGQPWMLGVNGIEKHFVALARGFRRATSEMLALYPHLRNFVHSENTQAIRLLAWCGFSLRDPAPFGASAELFHLFERKA